MGDLGAGPRPSPFAAWCWVQERAPAAPAWIEKGLGRTRCSVLVCPCIGNQEIHKPRLLLLHPELELSNHIIILIAFSILIQPQTHSCLCQPVPKIILSEVTWSIGTIPEYKQLLSHPNPHITHHIAILWQFPAAQGPEVSASLFLSLTALIFGPHCLESLSLHLSHSCHRTRSPCYAAFPAPTPPPLLRCPCSCSSFSPPSPPPSPFSSLWPSAPTAYFQFPSLHVSRHCTM